LKNHLYKIISFYEDNLNSHEDGHEVLGWGSESSQLKRFEILSKIYDLNGSSVLDVGCGLGDLYMWFKKNKIQVDYLGIDITTKMILKAKKKYPKASFKICDLINNFHSLNRVDFVLASGIFNRKIKNHEKFVKNMIAKMYEKCNRALGFNILSTRADFQEKNEYYADPEELLQYCKELSKNVIMNHEYMNHDVTYFLYK